MSTYDIQGTTEILRTPQQTSSACACQASAGYQGDIREVRSVRVHADGGRGQGVRKGFPVRTKLKQIRRVRRK